MAEYIERAKAVDRFTFEQGDYIPEKLIDGYDNVVAVRTIKRVLREIPAADVAPVVHGEWVYDQNATDWGIGGYVCSQCKNKNNNLPCNRVKSALMFSGARYCPNCGAKMDAET